MSRFIDQYLPDCVAGYPVIASPRWSTLITQVDSGAEQVNQQWSNPLNRYTLPEAVRTMTIFNELRTHWLMMRGPAHTFPFRDPLDFASVDLVHPAKVPTITDSDQIIGTGDGFTRSFQLIKTYGTGENAYTRTIKLPVVDSVLINVNYTESDGTSPTWTVDRETGVVTFDTAPISGRLIQAGFLFDVPVRFEADTSFDGIVSTWSLGGFADIPLVETRMC